MRPRGATRRAGRPRANKEAAKKSLGCKKMLLCSLHHHVKTARRLRRQCKGTRTGLRLRSGLQ